MEGVTGCCFKIAGGFRGYALPDNDSRTEIKVPLHNVKQLSLTLVRGPVVEDGNGEGMGNSDSIGNLIHHTYTHIL